MLIGLDILQVEELAKNFELFRNYGYERISLPIFNKMIHHDTELLEHDISKYISWSGADLILKYSDWSSFVNGRLSSWNFDNIDPNEDLVAYSRIMRAELDYALHLSLRSVSFELKLNSSVSCISQIITELYAQNRLRLQISVILDLTSYEREDDHDLCCGSYQYYLSLIDRWRTLNAMCNFIPNLSAVVKMSKNRSIDAQLIHLLCGESITGIIFSHSIFTLNNKNFPILSNIVKGVIQSFIKCPKLCLTVSTDLNDTCLSLYSQYFKHIEQKYYCLTSNNDLLDYHDMPQTPLQPLSTNLESGIYQVFEEDPIKYDLYEQAITAYLMDHLPKGHIIRILVVGAGRGPLVTRCVKAADNLKCRVEIYAMEKNANAIPTLMDLEKNVWNRVTIVHEDIRKWKSDLKFDLIVSELLGSFGDNELSPECLDPAESFLKPGGVFIPSSYSSYLAPISAPKLYSNICHLQTLQENSSDICQIPYVTFFHTSNNLDWPKICFQFNHPKERESTTYSSVTNERCKTITFESRLNGILHGFSGYFSCILYKDITMSINPTSFSVGMSSWFPIFFPLKCPVDVKAGVRVVLTMWRRVSSSFVWYEWCLESPYTSTIHNSGGKHFKMYLN